MPWQTALSMIIVNKNNLTYGTWGMQISPNDMAVLCQRYDAIRVTASDCDMQSMCLVTVCWFVGHSPTR